MRRKSFILSIILMLLITGGLFDSKGRVRGTVRNKDGHPIHSAKVKPVCQEDHGTDGAEVETDENGEFITEELTNALYLLKVTKDGYIQKEVNAIMNFTLFSNGDGFNCSTSIDIDVTLEEEGGTVSEENLVHYWGFNESSGTVVYDSIGGLNGAITGATWTSGKSGTALDFDPGANDGSRYVSLGSIDLTSLTDATIELWVNMNRVEEAEVANFGIFGYVIDADNRIILYYVGVADKMQFYIIKDGSYKLVYYNKDWSIGEWVHLAVTFGDNGKMKVYCNGSLSSQAPETACSVCFDDIGVANESFIGKYWSGAYSFLGKIDEVRIYNKVKTAEEIIADYNAQK